MKTCKVLFLTFGFPTLGLTHEGILTVIIVQFMLVGMYLGSAAAMYTLPTVVAKFGPGALLKLVGTMGFSWTVLWYFIGKDAPVRYFSLIKMVRNLAME